MKIGIVDDRDEVRESLAINVKLKLEDLEHDDIEVIDILPFLNREDYIQWILEEDIGAIIIDEKLEENEISGIHVDYQGHDVGKFLAKRLPNFPLFIVTTDRGQQLVDDNLKQFYLILDRKEFNGKSIEYVNLIVNSGLNYLNDNEEMLSELEEISIRIATDNASDEDVKRHAAIRQKIGLVSDSESARDRNDAIQKVENRTEEINKLSSIIIDLINRDGVQDS